MDKVAITIDISQISLTLGGVANPKGKKTIIHAPYDTPFISTAVSLGISIDQLASTMAPVLRRATEVAISQIDARTEGFAHPDLRDAFIMNTLGRFFAAVEKAGR